MVWNSKEDAGEDERAFYVGEQTDSRSSRRKCLVVFLAIALVAVLIAIIVPVTLSLKSTDTEDTKPVVTPAPVTAACAASQYPETCSETLANSTHTNAQVFTKTTATAASEGLVETRLAVRNSETPENAPAVEVCLDTLSTAAEEMNAVIAALNSTDSDALKDAFDDIKTRLSAAMEFHTTCIDALEEIEGGLGDSVRVISAKTNELFSIALAFVNAFSKFGNNLLLWATSPIDEFSDQHRRRLLASENEDIVNDIPEWLGAEQRRHLLQAKPAVVPCNITVAQDKSGNFTTIMDALKKTPEDVTGLFLICIKKGTYKEQVIINKPLTNIMFRGDGVRTTIITGSLSVALTKNMTTYMSATVIVQGEGFIAQGITFQNTAGPKGHQAVAVRVTADRAAFYQCNFDGFQDTLYAHNYRQYYRDCTIMGTIDYIFGNSIAVFQNCRLLAKKSTQVGQTNLYTAQGKTDRSQPTGFSFQECIFDGTSELVRNQKTFRTFLGRPWKPYSTAVLLRSTIQGHVDPAGWSPWNNSDYGLKTSYFAEFESKGPGAGPKQISARVPWSKQIKTLKDANRFQAGKFIQGNRWVPAKRYPNIPYTGDALK